MLRLLLYALVAYITFLPSVDGATLYSRANGNWSTVGTWSYTLGGASCGCTPIASDDVTINHSVNMDKHLTNVGSSLNGITGILTINVGGSLLGGNTFDLDIRSTGQLYLCGTLTTRDLTFSNGSIVNVCATGNLVVNRDFFNKNNSNSITIDGTMTVGREYENGNGGIISGNGTINILNGPVINTGSTYGCEGFNPCNNVYPCSIVAPCLSPLPVSFLEISAEWVEHQAVRVRWTTASEVNNHYFDVLRSTNGADFVKVGTVPGHGTTSQAHTYAFIDSELPLMQLLYYKIRQVDYDGQYSFSKTVAVARKASGFQVHVYPNPFHAGDHAFLDLAIVNGQADVHVEILDATGRCAYKEVLTTTGSYTTARLPVSGLAAGMYLLKATCLDQKVTWRIVALR